MNLPLVDELQWLVLTVYMEAQGEPYDGQLAVAWTIKNRTHHESLPKSYSDIVLQRLQFSAWNTASPTRDHLDTIDPNGASWYSCYRASASAYFALEPDLSGGATHYLNLESVKITPPWYDPSKVTAKIGRHTFLRL